MPAPAWRRSVSVTSMSVGGQIDVKGDGDVLHDPPLIGNCCSCPNLTLATGGAMFDAALRLVVHDDDKLCSLAGLRAQRFVGDDHR